MKILIATGLYPPESGGPATFAKLSEDNLKDKGFEIIVVPFSRVRKYPKIIRHVRYFFELWKVAREVDVVLALDPVSVGLPARFLADIKNLPFMVRLGGDYAWEQGKQRYSITCNLDDFYKEKNLPIGLKILKSVQKFVVQSADRVIAPSEYLKSIISGWGVDEANIEVIYSVSYLKYREEFDENYLISNEKLTDYSPVIFSIARLVPWKGFEVLIDVIEELRKKYPKIVLLIGGDGPLQIELEEKVKSLKLNKNVKLLGLLKREEIELISRHVEVFVLNTEYEGFSHQLMECMELDMPIVTTDVGGNPELILHHKTGLLVEYNNQDQIRDAIITLLESESLRASFCANAHKRLKKFTKEKSIRRLESVIKDVLKKV